MNEARIKLAETMFPDKKIYHIEPSRDDGGLIGYYLANGNFRTLNPFTDANDDYAVLRWMREDDRQFDKFKPELTFPLSSYGIGDYARAACKVLGIKYNEN